MRLSTPTLCVLLSSLISNFVYAQTGGDFKPMVVTPGGNSSSGKGFGGTKGQGPVSPGPNGPGVPGGTEPNENGSPNNPLQYPPNPPFSSGSLGGGGFHPKTDGSEYYNGESGLGAKGGYEYFGPGVMEKCDQASANALERLQEAKNFRASCPAVQKGATQRIAINDYSIRPSYMFIFDEHDKCIGKTMVAFGNGAGGAQSACGDDGSHLTPPGFHLTALHSSGRFNPGNCLKMVGAQGQGSVGRGILIHGTGAPGTSSTWGCSGVPYSAFKAVQTALGYGALVYNYFKPEQLANGCRNRRGISVNDACQIDPGVSVPNSTGGTPAVAWWESLLAGVEADAALPALPPRESIKKGTEITIFQYNPKSDTFEITMVNEEAVGPNVVTPEGLQSAIGVSGSLADFRKRLHRNVGANYVLKKNLPLLWGREIYKRQQRR